jgi:NAD(P)-dependent dehydrogenase (short-subunit alcohol dehydrogenase family)
MELKDKVVVITGASSGLGASLAGALAKEGAKLVVSSNDENELKKVAVEIGAEPFVADVTAEDQIKALTDYAVQKFGKIDLWINNAGIWTPHRPVEEQDSETVHKMMEVNFFGTFYGSKSALVQMKKQGSGTIINIISVSALEGRPNSSGYSATKFAVDGFTKSLRLEAAPSNIKVLSLFPAGMKTHLFDENSPENYETYMELSEVTNRILENLKKETPVEEQVIRKG